ncbi:MAG: hypothetical protein KTR14_03915 [Vampirovibrio sp.]|nr:hypothetical protein [Vampirovibrio sp.]
MNIYSSFAALCLLVLSPLVLIGCGQSNERAGDDSGKTLFDRPSVEIQVVEPPDIPAPPDANDIGEDAIVKADQLRRQRKTLMKNAFERALELGIIHRETLPSNMPENLSRLFDGDKPVTRGDFAQWLAASQGLKPVWSADRTFLDAATYGQRDGIIEAVYRRGWMKGVSTTKNPISNPRHFHPEKHLTRTEAAQIYWRVKTTGLTAPPITEDTILETLPQGVENPRYSFGYFEDLQQIPKENQAAVALAYRDGVLTDVFEKTPDQLLAKDGLLPQQKLTRSEALLFLTVLNHPVFDPALSELEKEAEQVSEADTVGTP